MSAVRCVRACCHGSWVPARWPHLTTGSCPAARRHFEDIQGRLEAAVEQASVPLALMPDVQVWPCRLLFSCIEAAGMQLHTRSPCTQRSRTYL